MRKVLTKYGQFDIIINRAYPFGGIYMKKLGACFFSAALIFAVYLFFHIFNIGCPIKFISGISCAGCGMSRAWLSVLNGDFCGAFYFHPLFIIPPVYLIAFSFKNKMGAAAFKTVTVVFASVFIAVYAIRLFNPGDTVVVFEPKNGWIMKLLLKIRGN